MIKLFTITACVICTILQADVLPLTQRYFHHEDQGYEYSRGTYMIILAEENLETYLMNYENSGDFIEFKRTQGYDVVVKTFDEVGGTAQYLRAYLQWYYEEQDSLLEYVILVGDVNGSYAIPSFSIGSYNENEDDVTDYPYSYFGDDITDNKFFVGRWSVRQIQDLLSLKMRSIQYIIMDNISDYSYLNNGLLVAGNYNGEDDAPNTWPVTPVWTSLWLQDELYNYGYSEVDTALFHLTNQNTENAQIAASWNNGIGIINYRGWGDANGWHKPYFHRENIDELTNGWKLPIVMSFVCNTGDFGNSIDQCYGEWMLKAGSPSSPKGAAAMIGPSDLDTDTRFNNVMCGVMWDEMLEERIPELGPALHAGKQAVQNEFPGYAVNGQNIGEFYHHVYGVLGDPSLPVWLKEPGNLSADIEETPTLNQSHLSTVITNESGDFIMDVVGALIYEGELVGKGLSNQNGVLDIDFENMSEGETLYLYLNKPQFFQKQIELTFANDDGTEFTQNEYEIPTLQSGIIYNFYDSESGNENAPVYNWVEISDVGTNLGLTDDSHITDIGIGFGFPYYGEVFNSMTVCSNGWASFLPCLDGDNDGECNSISHFFNNSITHPIGPYGMLAPFYDDLDDNVGIEPLDVFSYQDFDNGRFIIQWNNIANGQHDEDCIPGDDDSCPKETFQLILSPDGEILFQYKEVNNVDDHGCTIGIESPDKDDGVEYIFYNQQDENASGLTNEMAILFLPDVNYGGMVISYLSDWNLVGLPLDVLDNSYTAVFPEAIPGTLYSFDGTYYQTQELDHGIGYWLKFENSGSTTLSGEPLNDITVNLAMDWNLISGVTQSVYLSQIEDPNEIIIPGTLYGFSETYEQESSLEPGKGYWLRTSAFGEIVISSNSRKTTTTFVNRLEDGNTIEINGMKLYFGIDIPESEKFSYSLPPKPPTGTFDARFSGGWIFPAESNVIVVMHMFQPIKIKYDIKVEIENESKWALRNLETNECVDLNGRNGSLTIDFSDKYRLEKLENKIPNEFKISQNFPNPFNPSTTIQYELPFRAKVRITIFDHLGREVVQLVNDIQVAGMNFLEWNGRNQLGTEVSSGIYFYQVSSDEFIQSGKMVLVR